MSSHVPHSIGIVGLGNIGRYHAEQLSSLTAQLDVELVGGMDISPMARDRFEETFGVPTYDDSESLYETTDSVIITTPNQYHEEYAVGALAADNNVLIEKPVAHTTDSAKRVRESAKKSSGLCMVGFHNRFASPVQVLKQYIHDGRFGEIHHIEAKYIRRRGVPGRGTWFTEEASAGGGALIDIGAHAIDLALYLLGFPRVTEVSGVTRSVFGDRPDYTHLEMWGEHGDGPFDVDDSANAFIRCADNSTISLDVAWAANRTPSTEFVIQGTDAGARFDLSDGELTLFESSPTGAPHFSDTEITTRDENPHRQEQRRFIEAVRGSGPLSVNTVEQGLVVQQVMDATYRSSERNAAVTLDAAMPTAD
ncbi:Gfo/Idh/MocA family protein [Halocatena salina]|uniref:Gfo/Idh/MocA family oxidoreductase n=1 Tax=Halocatena salina TaxID=2934340 RepID=A0A8U0A6W3_9EURY|nr:Gfo/Idh/MocA family oxidoreductase [Halocatena salina]UPM43703.1 Gfo/Idh/MocA family oxidoreductase [Halocatena salina]